MRVVRATGLLLLLALGVSTRVRAQEILHPERIAPLVSRERIVQAATRDAEIARALASRATSPARRVDLAGERAARESELGQSLSLAGQARVTVEPEARRDWERITGRRLDTIDGPRASRECVEIARREHVMSDSAYGCRLVVDAERALPWPLRMAGYSAAFADDRTGDTSAAMYRQAVAALAERPDDRARRLALSSMQLLVLDSAAALETLRRLPARDYDALVHRALATHSLGRRDEAASMLASAILAEPDRPEAPFDDAQLSWGRTHDGRMSRERSIRALAGFRLNLCNEGPLETIPRGVHHAAAEAANELQVELEDPPNSSGGWSVRPVVPRDRLPPGMLDRWAPELPPLMDCAAARRRALEVLGGRAAAAPPSTASAPGVRAVAPPTASIVGPRPVFRWTGVGPAEIVICADRDCARVQSRERGNAGELRPRRGLPDGRWYWRVGDGPSRVLWVEANARGVSRVPDLDCDGWPDAPLGQSGWYARFASGAAVPELRVAPGYETATAQTEYAGDVDGDGCGDMVQSSGYGLWIAHGSVRGPEPPVFVPGTEQVNWAVAAGDVDADGYEDLLVDQSQRPELLRFGPRGSTAQGAPPIAPLAWRYLSIGDTDGDAWDDWAVFDNDYQAQTGRWSFHRGGRDGVSQTSVASVVAHYQPWALYPLGDVNGDGLADVAIWSHDQNVRDPPGRFRVFSGSARGTSARASAEVTTASPYVSIAAVGDLDGDGLGETVWRDESRVWLRRGARGGFGAETAMGPTALRASLVAVRVPREAGQAVLWVLQPPTRTAYRLENGQPSAVVIAAP